MTKKPTKAVMKNIETNLISATLGFGIATTAMNATIEASNMTMFTANNAGFI